MLADIITGWAGNDLVINENSVKQSDYLVYFKELTTSSGKTYIHLKNDYKFSK